MKLLNFIYNDHPQPWQIGFQDGATTTFYGIVDLHDNIIFYLIIVIIGVTWIQTSVMLDSYGNSDKHVYKYSHHGTLVEIIWTITPALILVAIAFPSFKLLYLMDSVVDPAVTVKAIGYQWYWGYNYGDYNEDISFDSFMVPTDELEMGQFRLLEVDNRVVVPVDTRVRIVVTAADVIHSFAVPSLGIKIDAIPGRINQASFLIDREGVYYGQCSELCGANHGFMPIAIEAVSLDRYVAWVDAQLS
uniref:Cytochrome c oxidase subunit 2 n=1 Tax=Allomyces macrogynus TaxID=28583 RepID=Q37396_ALLMA|nr:cytochrome oxidase subunit 2 [Allomyces macrogynus]AAC49227.1 cytochrome oxidase subunit 2 [Allomyces macrogynus]